MRREARGDSNMEHKEWVAKYGRMRDIADRIAKMRVARLRRISVEAGLDPQLLGIHPHNAWLAFEAGEPWAGVNYSKVRLIRRLQASEFTPSRIIAAWDKRVRGF